MRNHCPDGRSLEDLDVRRTQLRPRRARGRAVVALAVLLLLAVGCGEQVEVVTGALVPSPVHLTDGPPPPGARPEATMVVNVHNAGDTAASARRAAAARPSMIEVDLNWSNGHVVIAHTLLPGPLGLDTPRLGDAWSRTLGPGAVLLDVKSTSGGFVNALTPILRAHRDRPVYVSTPNAGGLRRLHAAAPWTRPLLSLTNHQQLRAFLDGRVRVPGLVGVSVKDSLLTRSAVHALRQRHLFILVYSVDDMARVNVLAEQGVRGITTDNLAIVRALTQPRLSPLR